MGGGIKGVGGIGEREAGGTAQPGLERGSGMLRQGCHGLMIQRSQPVKAVEVLDCEFRERVPG